MFWNKKEDKNKLPDLPPLKQPIIPPPLEEIEEKEKYALPSFSDSPHQNGFSQAAIKDAVSSEEIVSSEIMEENYDKGNEKFKTIEMEEWISSENMEVENSSQPKLEKLKNNKMQQFSSIPQSIFPQTSPSQDIFVKIDKFRSVKKALYETSEKLEEIDLLLQRIRETKMREEQELSAWEKEISSAKAQIQEITSTIFEKVE